MGYLNDGSFHELRRIVGLEILDHSLGNEKEGVDKGDRQQQIKIHADKINPEIADGTSRMPGDTSYEGRSYGDSHGSGDEVMEHEANHLRKIREGRLTAVTLPVGVGCETDRRIEGQVFRDRPEALGVQRQEMLQAKDGICKQKPDQAEDKKGYAVLLPGSVPFLCSIRKADKKALPQGEAPGRERFSPQDPKPA